MSDSLALTRTTGGPPKPIPEVPAFLNKLYTMVDDPATDDIIRWSEDVLSQDELGKQVLGNWFKHNKFSSFVRQLNMYGFHKMQQMKQGALKNAADDEIWQFQEPHFRRGRLDLLKLITRKKGASGIIAKAHEPNDNAIEFINDGETGGQPSASSAGPVALHTLADQLAVIKRNQSNILNDLNKLQVSNNRLWEETVASQTIQRKQQDTIDRIVKFLAGVFGNSPHAHTAHEVGSDSGRGSTQSPSPRPMGRQLLLEDGKPRGKTARSNNLMRRSNSTASDQFDTHRFTEATTPTEVGTDNLQFEEIDAKTPAAESRTPVNASLVPLRTPSRPPSRLSRHMTTAPDNTASAGGGAEGTNLNDFPLNPALAELLGSTSPNVLIAALSQMQSQQNAMSLDSLPVGMPFPDSSSRFIGDTNHPMDSDYPSQQHAQSFPLSYLPSATDSIFIPNSPRLTFQSQSSTHDDDATGEAASLFFPYEIDPAVTSVVEDTNRTCDSTQNVQNSVDQAQLNLDALMREIIRLNPNAFTGSSSSHPNQVNGELKYADGTRVEDLGDDGLLDDIGLPSVGSAVAHANAAAAAGSPFASTSGAGNEGVDIDSLFNSLNGDGGAGSNGLGSIENNAFDASQYLKTDTFDTAEPISAPQQQPPPQPRVTTLDASPREGRPKRKSDASLTNPDGIGLRLKHDEANGVDEQPPTKKLRMRRKQK